MDQWRLWALLTRENIVETLLFILGIAAVCVVVPLAAAIEGFLRED